MGTQHRLGKGKKVITAVRNEIFFFDACTLSLSLVSSNAEKK